MDLGPDDHDFGHPDDGFARSNHLGKFDHDRFACSPGSPGSSWFILEESSQNGPTVQVSELLQFAQNHSFLFLLLISLFMFVDNVFGGVSKPVKLPSL